MLTPKIHLTGFNGACTVCNQQTSDRRFSAGRRFATRRVRKGEQPWTFVNSLMHCLPWEVG